MKAKKLDGYQSPYATKITEVIEPAVYIDRKQNSVIITIDLPTYDCPLVLEVSRQEWEKERVKGWLKV